MANPYFDRQLRAIMDILRQDYAGLALSAEPVDFRYYMQAAGMAWKEGNLDQLLFLRYVNQMLATTMDRSLKLEIDSPDYTPWHVGFDTRRYGDALYVTAVQEDERLTPGDRILCLNKWTPAQHQVEFQKNFLFANTPEREQWHNVLKMTEHILVEHRDGSREDLPIHHFPGKRLMAKTDLREIRPGVMLLRVGAADAQTALEALVRQKQSALDGAERLIIDLRGMTGGDESLFLPLMPYIFASAKTMNEAVGERSYRSLYTVGNCARRIAQLQPYAESEEGQTLIMELRERAGCGWLKESYTLWDDVPEVITPRGDRTVLLTDTWTEGAAESLAALAKQEGRSTLIGRATMGNLDYAGLICVRISETARFTYPMSITEEAAEGRGYLGKGIRPEVVVPFTPEECTADIPLQRALAVR